MHGGQITLRVAEDGTTSHNDSPVQAGSEISGRNGLLYTLALQDGTWSATYQAVSRTVDLGESGQDVTLTQNEDGSWMLGSDDIASGGTTTAANGNVHILSLGPGGTWSAMFRAETMDIEGTPLTAISLEDQSGYSVRAAGAEAGMLGESGKGDITAPDGLKYRVWRFEDGSFGGAQFDTFDQKTGTVNPAWLADDEDTPIVNEANTKLRVNFAAVTGDNPVSAGEAAFSVDDLFDGAAEAEFDPHVDSAREDLTKILATFRNFQRLVEDDTDDDINEATCQAALNANWGRANTALQGKVFGNANTPGASTPFQLSGSNDAPRLRGSTTKVDFQAAIGALENAIEALSSQDAFVSATAADGGGVFEALEFKEDRAREVFDTRESEAKAQFGYTDNTRFGVAWKKLFENAADASPGGLQQAWFAYSALKNTPRRSHMGATGTATYAGQTTIMDDEDEGSDATPGLYVGDIALQVRLTSGTVNATVTNIQDQEGGPLTREAFGDVSSISLPSASMTNNAQYDSGGNTNTGATILYRPEPGSPGSETVTDARLRGRFLGRGEDAGIATIGDWRIESDDIDLLAAFGAERTGTGAVISPTGDSGAKLEKSSVVATSTGIAAADLSTTDNQARIKISDGNLVLSQKHTPSDPPGSAEVAAVEIGVASLFDNSGGNQKGTKITASVRAELQKLLTRMQNYLPLREDEATRATANAGRTEIWGSINTELKRIFDPNDAITGNLSTTTIGDNRAGNQEVVATLEALIDALANMDDFKAAFENSGIFDDDESPNSFALSRGKGDVFNQVAYQADVEYRNTDYTRFGVWWRRATANADVALARNGPAADGAAFAYSFQKRANYGTTAPDFPTNGRGTYEGRTVGFLSANGKQYEGDAALTVNWGAGSTLNDTTVRLELSNIQREDLGDPLVVHSGVGAPAGGINPGTHVIKANSRSRLPDSALASNPGTLQWLEVEAIILRNMKIENPSTEMAFTCSHGTGQGADDSHLEFRDINGIARNANRMLSGSGTAESNDKLPTATVNGLFVGKSLDGPLGVLGTFELDNLAIDLEADAATTDHPWTDHDRYLGHNGGTSDEATDRSVTFVGGFGADLVR